MRALRAVTGFVEERTGIGALWQSLFADQVRGGASWFHVFGNSLAVLLLVQALTGTVLMLTYTPSVHDAWSSTFFIQERITAGWFIRGLHTYAGQAMLIVLGFHMIQVVLFGAYRRPREMQWWLALAALGMLLGLLITGFRLPWDQRTYWALLVEMNIAAATPLAGEMLHDFAAGGSSIGQATLTRLYALHVVVLPLVLLLVLWAWRRLRLKHGPPTASWSDDAPRASGLPQLARDLLFVALVLGVCAVLTWNTHGASLDAPAEPSRDYPARPEWFLLPLYKLRILLPAHLETVATLVLPGAVAGFLFALPFLDRGRPGWAPRLPWLLGLLGIVGGAGALNAITYADDAADEEHQAALQKASERAERSHVLARRGVPPAGPVEMLRHDPQTQGRDVYAQYCSDCHVLEGEGKRKAPDHTGYGSRSWILALLQAPQDPHFFGKAEMSEDMPSQQKLGDVALRQVTEFLYSLGQEPQDPGSIDKAAVKAGRAVFEKKCMECHVYEGDGDFLGIGGPNLTFYASRTWTLRQIRDPDAPTQYHELNEMPAFADQLSAHDLRMVTSYLRRQRFAEIDFEVAQTGKKK